MKDLCVFTVERKWVTIRSGGLFSKEPHQQPVGPDLSLWVGQVFPNLPAYQNPLGCLLKIQVSGPQIIATESGSSEEKL